MLELELKKNGSLYIGKTKIEGEKIRGLHVISLSKLNDNSSLEGSVAATKSVDRIRANAFCRSEPSYTASETIYSVLFLEVPKKYLK